MVYPFLPPEGLALFEADHRKVLRIIGTPREGIHGVVITENDVIADSFQIDRYCCNGEKLEIGTAIAAQLTFTLENGDGRYDSVDFENMDLQVRVGVADWTVENPQVYWVNCGYFMPDEQPVKMSTIRITALDWMTKFDVVVDAADLTFPTTVAGLVGQVCSACGVTLAQSITGLPNASVSIAELPTVQDTLTYRTLIQWCAGIMATNAWVDWYGKLRFSWYSNASGSYESTTDNRYKSEMYKNDLAITGVEYTTTGGVPIVEGTDDYDFDITGNALAGPLIATVLPVINTTVNGFIYRPFTASVVNAPYLWPMDGVSFMDKDNNLHLSTLTNVTFGLNGSTALEAKGMTYVTNKAKYPKGFTREQAQLVNQAMEHVEQDIDESLTQQEIFNRLTDNGAAQGLVLYNGQLYINASYINAGELVADIIKGGTLTLGGANNVNGTLEVLDASGNVVGSWSSAGITINNGVISIPFTGGSLRIGGDATTPLSVNCSLEGVDYSLQIFGNELRFSDGNNTLGIGPASLTVYQAHSGSGKTPAVYLFGNSGQSAVLNGNEASLRLSDGTNSTYINYEQIETGRIFLSTPLGIPYGGTGANSPAQARTNLEITPANIGAVNKAGDTMTGPLTISDNLYGALGSTGFRNVGPSGAFSYLCTENDFYGSGGGWGHFIICNHGNGETYFNYVLRLPFWDSPKYKRQLGSTSAQTPWYDFLTSEKTVTVLQGGTGATTAAGAISKLFDISANDARNYPNAPGVYRTVGTNIFSHLQPGSTYGVLIIIGRVYAAHFYIDAYSNMFVGFSGDVFGEPTTWKKCTP